MKWNGKQKKKPKIYLLHVITTFECKSIKYYMILKLNKIFEDSDAHLSERPPTGSLIIQIYRRK